MTIAQEIIPQELLQLDPGEVIELTRKKKQSEPLPPYNIVGNGFTNRHGTSVDVLEVCLQMNLAELRLLQFLRNAFTTNSIKKEEVPNLIEPVKWDQFDKYLATALMKNYTHLEYLQVLLRLKRGMYLLNPTLFIPSHNYLGIQLMWDKATLEKEKDAIQV